MNHAMSAKLLVHARSCLSCFLGSGICDEAKDIITKTLADNSPDGMAELIATTRARMVVGYKVDRQQYIEVVDLRDGKDGEFGVYRRVNDSIEANRLHRTAKERAEAVAKNMVAIILDLTR